MIRVITRRMAATIVVSAFLVFWQAAPALAQYTTSAPRGESKPLFEWVLAALFTGGCVAIAFMNPKRSHLS